MSLESGVVWEGEVLDERTYVGLDIQDTHVINDCKQ